MPFAYLLLAVYGLLLIAAPAFIIGLYVRNARLQRRLNELAEENSKQHAALQRAIGQLQSKMAAAPADAAASGEKATAEVRQPIPVPRAFVTPPVPARDEVKPPSAPTMPTPPVSVPSTHTAEKKPEPVFEPKPLVPAQPVLTPPAVTTSASVPPTVPPAAKPLAPLEPKPVAPAATPPHVEPKPATPAAPKVTPPAAPHVPPKHTPPAAEIPHPVAARISTSPSTSPLRMPAAKPTLQQSMKAVSSIEELLGANWFAKLGVVMTVIGMALLGKLALQNLGPTGKAFIVYAVSLLFLAGGIFLEKRDRYQLLGRVGIGGGWALLFFSTFGIHYVPAMQILDSGIVDSVLMLIVAVAMGAHTLRYRSQLVTGFAFLLAYTTVALSQDTVYSLTAGVMLAVGLVGMVLKMSWFELEVFGILASYLNHLYWLYRLLGIHGAQGHSFPEYHASLALLFFYWLIFRVSYVARGIKTGFEERVSAVSAVLNTLLLLGALKFQSVNPELAYIALFAVGALELAFALLPVTRKRRQAFVLLSILGTSLVIAAVPSHYSGNDVAILWLVGAEVFLAAGMLFEEVVFRRLGLFTGLLVGADLLFYNFRPLLELRAKSEALFLSAGLLFGLCGVAFYLNALYVGSRWGKLFDSSLDRALLILHSYLGAFAAATAAWALCSNDWTAVAFAAVMLILAALNRRIASRHLQVQYALIGILTMYRAFAFNLHIEGPAHTHIATRLITLPLLGAMLYATAKIAQVNEDQAQRIFRALFSFAGAFLFGLLIWTEAPEIWMAALFLAAAIIVAFAARRWDLLHLSVQEHLFAVATVVRTLEYNGHVGGHYGPFSIRLITVSLVAAGLYAISRKATNPSASHSLVAAYLHTTAATFLLALLMWYEASTGWLVALWALFAFSLTAIDRRFQLHDLRWQAHALAAITMVRCIGINLTNEELWHNISVRLLTLSIVAVIFYAMSLLIRMPDEWRARDFHHIYSWSASLLVSLLLWYELDPLARAVGWAIFGFVLFEYGFLRKISQYRYQAYVAFVAAFARIFFANLTAGLRGELFGPRMYTVLPLILILFFVYAQLAEEQSGGRPIRFRSDALVAYLGTAALVALFYFQFDLEWVVVSYSAVALALFAIAWATKREIFLHQGILVTLGTLARGMAHNLFGSSNFANGNWTGRYMIVSIAVAILLATLFFAFPLRESYKASPNSARRGRLAALFVGHPEQLQFFVSVILVTTMLALKNTEAMITVSWGIEALCIVLLALVARERIFLQAGFGLLLLCAGKTFAMDMWRLDLLGRTITFIGVGLAITVVSLLYIRYQDHLRRYL